jgi:hypothetical protein
MLELIVTNKFEVPGKKRLNLVAIGRNSVKADIRSDHGSCGFSLPYFLLLSDMEKAL